MKVGVVGTGYVGLVSGTCFAELGNDVVCVDNNPEKVAGLRAGNIPIYEPGLQDLFDKNVKEGRLHFTTKLADALSSEVIFLALPTPPGGDGRADLSYVLGAAEDIGKALPNYSVIVDKSTVPVGTSAKVRAKIKANAKTSFDVVSNPEFLREGSAVDDFLSPNRIIVGASSDRARRVMKQLYRPLVRSEPHKLIFTDEPSAEMIKYAANAMLATRISFVNELSGLCEAVGADIEMVRAGIGSDNRIGPAFLYPGPGYGGSCFPKDTLALAKTAEEAGLQLGIVEATIRANTRQKQVVARKVLDYFGGDVKGKKFALWGLAFKENTDDVRESPALTIIEELTSKGAEITAFDPQAIGTTKKEIERRGGNKLLSYGKDEYSVLKNADALIIATNWKEFFNPDFGKIKNSLKAPVIFDGRNLYDLETMKQAGFYYASIGRQVVKKHV